jgi:hypothetical protein
VPAMIFIDNKYTKWYHAIVQNANLRTLPDGTYVESHHIIPRSLGGNNSKENLVKLTAREHFVCHLLLTKMVTGPAQYQMLSAVTRFQQSRKYQKRILTSWEYQKIRECAISARVGQRHTDEARQKIKDKHHDVSGANNPRAKHIQAVAPDGTVYNLLGTLKKFCKEQGLAYSSVLRALSVHSKWRKSFNGSTKGWTFTHL